MQEGFAFVPATVGGRPVSFLLDTGAQGMLLLPEAAAALRLPDDARGGTRLLGTGGSRVAPNVILRGMALGGMEVASGSRHLVPLDRPEALARIVEGFCADAVASAEACAPPRS